MSITHSHSPTKWVIGNDAFCPYCGGEHHYWDCEIYDEVIENLWIFSRGATSHRPTFWACTGCGYNYWAYEREQDPMMDGHCIGGEWRADSQALEALIDARS